VEPQCLVGFSRLGPAPHDPQALPTPTSRSHRNFWAGGMMEFVLVLRLVGNV
jgi:hydroxyacyl-ACP dehydratase HTD2-like protein with hotdog domain